MTSSIVGSRYARALVDVIFDPHSPVKVADAIAQLRDIEQTIAGSPDLQAILMTPAVQTARKRAVIRNLGEQLGVSQVIRNFLAVVLDHERIAQLSAIREAFEQLVDERLGYVRADVISAAPLDDAEKQKIEAELVGVSGKQIRMRTEVDPALLGGVVARIGSTVYDGSLRGQLEGLRRKLTSESADYKVEI